MFVWGGRAGCFCGLTCLRLARDIVRSGEAGERRAVLVVGCEVPTIMCNETVGDGTSLVSHSLFNDGAGAFIISTEGEWRLASAGMNLIPDSKSLLQFEPHGRIGQPR